MNSCYGCVLQLEGVWQVHPYCKSCTSEGSHYFARPDFDKWHENNARQKGNIEAQHSGGVEAKPGSQQLKPKMPTLQEFLSFVLSKDFVSNNEIYEFFARHFGR